MASETPHSNAAGADSSSRGDLPPISIDNPKKRLFVCCDGTWQDAISTDYTLTNVARLSRCIKSVSSEDDGDPVLQIVYYRTGIGRGTSMVGRAVDGLTGRGRLTGSTYIGPSTLTRSSVGISTNIRDAYSFICHNFNNDRDEIYLVGFSRGAFTVCCLARLIRDIGILTKFGLSLLPELFKDWKIAMREANSEESENWPGKSPLELTDELAMLEENREKRQSGLKNLHLKISELGPELVAARDVRIKGIGIWDAVSALGIPIPLQLPQPKGKRFRWVHADIPENVDHCYQALALDERRKHFRPVIWKSTNRCPPRSRMKQCWFMGTHGDVGGGNPNGIGLSNLSLIWMMAHLTKAGVDFDQKTLSAFLAPNNSSSLSPSLDVGRHSSMHPKPGVSHHTEDGHQGRIL